ncbi:gamma-tubulin complex component 5-like [Rhinoderma darwinii]|uniref:gamma-tubulin complex component 5-like n=1 Tax=Rhinoderma darwinii TaxID=43563 RepID=UPI003F6668A1
MEGEDIGLSADDTPEWSDISEEEDDQETLSREDSGIQVDRTPLDDGEKKSAAPVVSWKGLCLSKLPHMAKLCSEFRNVWMTSPVFVLRIHCSGPIQPPKKVLKLHSEHIRPLCGLCVNT